MRRRVWTGYNGVPAGSVSPFRHATRLSFSIPVAATQKCASAPVGAMSEALALWVGLALFSDFGIFHYTDKQPEPAVT
jgi:hypothetical protein